MTNNNNKSKSTLKFCNTWLSACENSKICLLRIRVLSSVDKELSLFVITLILNNSCEQSLYCMILSFSSLNNIFYIKKKKTGNKVSIENSFKILMRKWEN